MKYRKLSRVLVCAVLGLVFLTAQAVAAQRVFVDMLGNSVTIPTPDKIERVGVLTSPQVQIMYIIGQQDKLVAMTQSQYRFKLFEKFYPDQANISAPRKQAADMNIEALLASKPQFCIGSSMDMDLVDKATRIPTVRIDTQDDPARVFETRKNEVTMFGEIFGAQDRAKAYCDYLDKTINQLKEKTTSISDGKKLKVYLGFNPDHLTTYGGDTFMQYQIEAAGLINAASGIKSAGGREGGLATVSMENILMWNPDILIIDNGTVDAIKADSKWANINAVKNNKIFILPVGGFIWNRPSAESAVLLPTWLAMNAYPDLFKETNIKDEIKRYWKDIIGFELSDEDVNSILTPPQFTGGGQGAGK